MQGMAVSGAPAAHTSAFTVTIAPTFEVDSQELKDAVLETLEDEGVLPTTATIINNRPRSGVLCSFDDASSARRANDILRHLADEKPGHFLINLLIKHPSDGASGSGMRRTGRQISMNPTYFQIRKPGKDSKYCWYYSQPAQAGAGATGAEPAANAEAPGPAAAANAEAAGAVAAAAAAAAFEPLPPPPAEPAGSSQRARMGCHRHHTSTTPPSVNFSSSRRRDYRETARESRRRGRERGSGSGSGSRHYTPQRSHVSRRELEARLLALRPFASACHLKAPRRRDAVQPFSGLDEMYIGQQQGQACSIKNVGSLNFPTMLFDSLAGARIMRGVAALLHKEFVPPPAISVVSDRLKRCYDSLLPTKLRRMLVSDCRAFVGCRHADVDRRGIEAYLTRVLHPMLARR